MTAIIIQNLTKYFPYGKEQMFVLDKINLDIRSGEFLTIFGPNGCGKTTFLNIIAGLDTAYAGKISTKGDSSKIGFVFQNYRESLFPWRTVQQNVEFALEKNIKDKKKRAEVACIYLEDVGLLDFAKKYPYQLSGGMRQLVAIVRALAYKPDVFLMDEPFSGLDYDNRLKMEDKILQIWEKFKKTTVFVSHDIDEAVFLADRIIVMSQRPSHIKKIINVNLKRPRTMETRMCKRFFSIKNRVLSVFKEELYHETVF